MGDVRGSISYASGSSRRPRSSLVERRESSLSRNRHRSPPPPPSPPPRYYYHGRARDDGDSEEHDEQRRREDERDSLWHDESSGGSESDADNVVQARRRRRGGHDADNVFVEVRRRRVVVEEWSESEHSDDDRPIGALVRRGSTSNAPPAPAPAPPEPPAQPAPPSPAFAESGTSVTVENTSVFDCTICYLPLKPPIFQCPVGHVVCSPCHGKLGQAATCHVCRLPLPVPGGYLRCNAMEKVVEAIRVACPHAAHGCAVRTAYHDLDDHASTCAHRPCHCPRDGCGFAGAVRTTLLEHFAAAHGWPCSAGSASGGIFGVRSFAVRLRKGFNVVTASVADDDDDDDQGGGGATTTEEEQYTLVLNVEQAALSCDAITAFCIHPFKTGVVKLGLSYDRLWRRHDSGKFFKYTQSSELEVVCTDLSNGAPGPGSCFPLLVPRWSAAPGGGGEDGDDITVTVSYISGTR